MQGENTEIQSSPVLSLKHQQKPQIEVKRTLPKVRSPVKLHPMGCTHCQVHRNEAVFHYAPLSLKRECHEISFLSLHIYFSMYVCINLSSCFMHITNVEQLSMQVQIFCLHCILTNTCNKPEYKSKCLMGLNKKLLDSELRCVLIHELEENLDALVDGPARSTVFFCF